ncbi:MAG: sulfatase family protein [Candidatus Ratteibacteria bacterium]
MLHIITHDTGRYLGCYGQDVDTPNINKIAEDGIIFTNYFCTAPQCSPSRASMFSSLMPHNNGVFGLSHRGFLLKENVPYLPKILKDNGYNTLLFGIQHETNWKKSQILGYSEIVCGKTSSCKEVSSLLINYLNSNPKEPFFISAGFAETHLPWPIIENFKRNIKVPEFLPDEIEVKKDIVGLHTVVKEVDDAIGRIIEALKRNKILERTIIIFTTDHGLPLPGAKATLFDPGIGIFLILKDKELFSGGKKIDCLSSNLDLMPTILDYIGIETPKNIRGVSLIPVIRGEKREIRDEIYIELTYHAAYDPMRGIRTKKYKYIRNFEVRPFYFPPNVDNSFSKELFKKLGYFDRIRPFEMFFDIEKDPLERKNLINSNDYKKIIEEMRNKLMKWMRETDDPLLKGHVFPPENSKITPPWAYDPKTLW